MSDDVTSSSGEAAPVQPTPSEPLTAGALLKQARVAKGLHIAALAASIKVTPRKLELLEADRFEELPGAAFTRALAQTVCRTLKIDPTPVMALIPHLGGQAGLSQMRPSLNAPFREKPGSRVPNDLGFMSSRVVVGAMLLVIAGVVLYLVPTPWINGLMQRDATTDEPVAAVSDPVLVPSETMASVPATEPASAAALVEAPATAGSASAAVAAMAMPAASEAAAGLVEDSILTLRTTAPSWVEVTDARGSTLISRLLQSGESVGVDGTLPLRVRIGNASATLVSFKGKPVDVVAGRGNVAKFELK